MSIKNLLESYEEDFQKEFKNLLSENCFIGGTIALNLIGVKTRRKPVDLDIIIFKPTEYQKNFCLKNMSNCSDYSEDEESDNKATIYRVNGKFEKSLNIIFVENLEQEGVLFYRLSGRDIAINSFENIIKAKSYYIKHSSSEETKQKHKKDLSFILQNML